MRFASALLLLSLAADVCAEEALIAVATNFTMTAEKLQQAFESRSEHRLHIASGSTGKLYAQVLNGAPYDALLAADELRPELLEASVFGVPGSRFTFATGRLVLWSADDSMILGDISATLRQNRVKRIAIANPELAPYGLAAWQALQALGLDEALAGRIVRGENIGQAYALVATANAQAGFVAMSYVRSDRERRGAFIEVRADLYSPLRQDGLLLRHGVDNEAAKAFLQYLREDDARALLEASGYR